MNYPIGAWKILTEQKMFRLYNNYDINWKVNLDESIGAIASAGGAIAIARDPLQFATTSNPGIQVYDLSGHPLCTVELPSLEVRQLGWTRAEHLVALLSDGRVLVLTTTGLLLHQYTILEEGEYCVCSCVFDDQIALWTSEETLKVIENVESSTSRIYERKITPDEMGDNGDHPQVKCIAGTAQGKQMIFLGLTNGFVLAVVDDRAIIAPIADGAFPIVRLAISSDGQRVAAWAVRSGPLSDGDEELRVGDGPVDEEAVDNLLDFQIGQEEEEGSGSVDEDEDGDVATMGSANQQAQGQLHFFTRHFELLGTGSNEFRIYPYTPPILQWIGSQALAMAVVIHGRHETFWQLVAMEPDQHVVKIGRLLCRPLLQTEVDGCRVVTEFNSSFLHAVHPALVEAFSIRQQSTPLARAVDALQKYRAGSVQANTAETDPSDAAQIVDDLASAAAAEPDPHWQTQILAAAAFASTMSAGYSPVVTAQITSCTSHLVEVTRQLRATNTLYESSAKMPMTPAQLTQLGTPALVARLSHRRCYGIAATTAGWLGSKEAEATCVLYWALDVLRSQMSDETALQHIDARFQQTPTAQLPQLVAAVREDNLLLQQRRNLLRNLADREPDVNRRAELQLLCDNPSNALKDAVQAGNSEMLQTIFAHLRGQGETVDQIVLRASQFPAALAHLALFAFYSDPELLRAIAEYLKTQRAAQPVERRQLLPRVPEGLIFLALREPEAPEVPQLLAQAEATASPTLAAELAKQRVLLVEQANNPELRGMTLLDAIRHLCSRGVEPSRLLMQQVTKRGGQCAKARGYVEARNFDALAKLGGDIPKYIYQLCMDASYRDQAVVFARRFPDPVERALALYRARAVDECIEVARKLKSDQSLLAVYEGLRSDVTARARLLQACPQLQSLGVSGDELPRRDD